MDSINDEQGKPFALHVTRKPEVPGYQTMYWILTGTVRDDLGNPLEGVKVQFYRGDSIRYEGVQTVTTVADGKYSFKIIAHNTNRSEDEDGGFISLKAIKEGFFEQNLNRNNLIFLSDIKNPAGRTFTYKNSETSHWAPPLESATFDLMLRRNPSVEGILRADDGKPLVGYPMFMGSDMEFDAFDSDMQTDIRSINTDKEGKFRIEKFPAEVKFWFVTADQRENDNDILRTNNVIFAPGAAYKVGLRLKKGENDSRRLMLETIMDADGNDVSPQIVSEDVRTKPLLTGEPEKRGRELLAKMNQKVMPMLKTTTRGVATLQYTFYLGDKPTEYEVSPYAGSMFGERIGITQSSILYTIVDSISSVRFRNIEEDENEIRLYTNIAGRYGIGNGVQNSWVGYSSGRFTEAQVVLDAQTMLPKRITADGFEEEYHDFVPLGSGFVPKQITSKAGSMAFDFRFKIHEPGIWLFNHAVREGATVCRIDNVRVELARWASAEEENKVRDALRKMKDVGAYWLSWYPKDLPEFSYTFHQVGMEPRVLSHKDIKEADNWYAEFYRKGISYIGISRLLLIDIDGVRCTSVIEDTEKGLLTFEFELAQEWMNAVGNGISGPWSGWFNGGVGKGTATLDTKTWTLVEVKTKSYDERYSDYFEVKPDKFVPRRIVIDYHKGNREAESEMFFDFRFKVYEPCLWLCDQSVVEGNDPLVRISDVFVDGKLALESSQSP
jgi:5-hydroxyisourate hydrolase-like protein (transthyretin family)